MFIIVIVPGTYLVDRGYYSRDRKRAMRFVTREDAACFDAEVGRDPNEYLCEGWQIVAA